MSDLITLNINYARKLAWKKNKLTGIEIEELISAAFFGLVLAGKKFNDDPAKFRAYAKKWIDGAMNRHGRWLRSFGHERITNNLKTNRRLGCFDDLSNEEKTLLDLYYKFGYTIDELSEETGLSRSAVYRNICKCKEKIISHFED